MSDFITGIFLLGALILGLQFVIWLLSIILPSKAFEWLMEKFEKAVNIKRVWFLQVLMSGLFLKALGDNEYVFYMRLRWVCLLCFGLLIAHSVANNRKGWAIAFGILTIIYNPIIPLHLVRDAWTLINIVSIIATLSSILVLKENRFEIVAAKIKGYDKSTKSEN